MMMEEHHPTADQISQVADVFERAAEQYSGSVDMRQDIVIVNEHHPTADQISQVVAVFERADKQYPENHVDMRQDTVMLHRDHACRTIACHAGYFALQVLSENDSVVWSHGIFHQYATTETSSPMPIRHTRGTQMMAEMLGFENDRQMRQYFMKHPERWGNKHAQSMFYDEISFDPDRCAHEGGFVTLADIARHWRGVERRTREITREIDELENVR